MTAALDSRVYLLRWDAELVPRDTWTDLSATTILASAITAIVLRHAPRDHAARAAEDI